MRIIGEDGLTRRTDKVTGKMNISHKNTKPISNAKQANSSNWEANVKHNQQP